MSEPKTPLQDFYDRCQSFDWYYGYSDDHSVWRRGSDGQKQLEAEADTSPEKRAIYDAWSRHYFSGKPWNTPKEPAPERPK